MKNFNYPQFDYCDQTLQKLIIRIKLNFNEPHETINYLQTD